MNGYLLSTTGVAILLVIGIVAFMFIARRVLRVAIRLALALTLVFAVLLTAALGWWRGWFSSSSQTPAHQTNRAGSNRSAR